MDVSRRRYDRERRAREAAEAMLESKSRELYGALLRVEAEGQARLRFLSTMSDEIRTPLAGILGMAELLGDALEAPEQREMVARISGAGRLLMNLLGDVLDLSALQARRLELEPAPFAPRELLDAMVGTHGAAAAEKGLRFVTEAGCGLDRMRMGDASRVAQVVHHLMGNAVKFTEAGEVRLGLAAEEALVIEVEDTGIGMDAAGVKRAFRDFAQVDGRVGRRYGGAGLGLSIASQLVEMMGGEIVVRSVPGEGTLMRVVLPLPLAEDVAEAGDCGALAGLRVLAADDNATNRAILEAMLPRLGMRPEVVSDGQHVVDRWKPELFDLVLLDINMPGLDGIAAARTIRACEANAGLRPVPIIAVTANAMSHQVAEYLANGFDACVAKPFRREDLVGAISATLARRCG